MDGFEEIPQKTKRRFWKENALANARTVRRFQLSFARQQKWRKKHCKLHNVRYQPYSLYGNGQAKNNKMTTFGTDILEEAN